MIAADARSGSTVGKYRLHEIVGRGGMGVVYRAEHVYIGREVAVKILHEGYGGREEAIKRFLREARAASLINHPNIVDVTDFGKANDGTVFFVMELLVGQSLDAVLAQERRLDLLRAITICNQLAAALAAAHSKDIIHRDLKPENVMLIEREGRRELIRLVTDERGAHEIPEREQKFDFVKILDFGVAKVREPAEPQKAGVTQTGVVFGTPEYMAPETARIGFSDARSDIYALGIMFYEMLTGTVPFVGDAPFEVMTKQVNAPVPAMSEVAPDAEITIEAERMILKALSKDPALRQQTMEEFHSDLQRCYGQLRFRRTLRAASDSGISFGATPPPVTPIPLTRKKHRPEVDARSAFPTTPLSSPATGPAVGSPILLIHRKAMRSDPVEPTPSPATMTKPGRAREPAAPGALSASSPPESRKRTTLPLPLGGNTLRAGAPTAPPSAAVERAALPDVMISDRPTPRVEISNHLANMGSGLAVGDDEDGEPRGSVPEVHPPWFDGPTVVRNPLEATRDSKRHRGS